MLAQQDRAFVRDTTKRRWKGSTTPKYGVDKKNYRTNRNRPSTEEVGSMREAHKEKGNKVEFEAPARISIHLLRPLG